MDKHEIKGIAENIVRLRKEKGYNQKALADHSKVSIAWIKVIETNKANPSIHILTKIARALDTDITGIVTGGV